MEKEKTAKVVEGYKNKAEKYVNNKEKTEKLLNEAREKLDDVQGDKGPLDKVIGDLKLLFSALNDWIRGNYKEFPIGSVVMIVIAVLYFVSPVDVIPDFIPVAGYVDDAAVIAFVISQVHGDLQKYKIWKEGRTV